jgi:glycosyltransferase involved in cell wall biosynthesis
VKILLASSFLLFEKTRFGGAKRLYNIARGLAEKHDLTVACFDGCHEATDWDGVPPFEKFLFIPTQRKPTRLPRARALNLAALLGLHQGALNEFFTSSRFDYVIMGYSLAPNFLRVPEVAAAPRIAYIEGDLVVWQADRNRRRASGFLRLLREIRYLQIRRYYRSFLKKVDVFFLSTQTEMEEVANRFPGTEVRRLPHGMGPADAPDIPSPTARNVAGFIGNFNHTPNLDALCWYLDNIHASLCARHPGYRFHIAGTGLSEATRLRIVRTPGILLHGAVDHVAIFYEGISFLVNPIVSGRGIRTKVLEAASYKRAVVSTRLGAEGTEPLEIALGDSPDEFARRCSEYIDGIRDAAETGRRNQVLLEKNFSSAAITQRLLEGLP